MPEASLAHLELVAARARRRHRHHRVHRRRSANEIAELATRAAIMLAPNMSVAVTVASRSLALIARALGDDYDVEITEIHHRYKKDAPSGTALAHGRGGRRRARPRSLDETGIYGRHGCTGERTTARRSRCISLRAGDVVGEHTVSFGTPGERLELTHRAHSRDTFARGALRAARLVAARPRSLLHAGRARPLDPLVAVTDKLLSTTCGSGRARRDEGRAIGRGVVLGGRRARRRSHRRRDVRRPRRRR